MKQKLYLCIAFFTMLFASCADQDVNENSLSEVEGSRYQGVDVDGRKYAG